MDFHEIALLFLRSTRQIPSVDENDFYADRMELDVNVDVVDFLDKSRTSFSINVVFVDQNRFAIITFFLNMYPYSDFRRISVVRT